MTDGEGPDRGGPEGAGPEGRISDTEITRIAGGATISFAGQAVGAVFKYVTQLVIALWLGAAMFGHYALGLAIYQFGELASGLGLRHGLVRFVSGHLESGDERRLKGVLVRGLQLPLLLGAAVALLFFLGADVLAVEVFGQPSLAPLLEAFALALPFGAMVYVTAYATTGREVSQYLVLIQEIVQPGANLLLVLLLLWAGAGLVGTAFAWVGASALAMAAGVHYVRKLYPVLGDEGVEPRFETRKLLRVSAPLALGQASWLLMLWTDVVVLGLVVEAGEVGVYRAVSQTALVIPIFLNAINTIFGPMIARHHAAGDRSRMASALETATRWSLLASLPFYLLMIVAPGDLLNVFGAEFRAGGAALAILATGQLVNAGSGGVSHTLMMSGRQDQKMVGDVVFALVNVGLNVLFVPRWGIEGAAVATGLSIAGLNVTRVLQVYLGLGIHAYSARYLKLAAAALVAAAGGALLNRALDPAHFLVSLAATGAAMALLYLGAMWLQGFEPEDGVVLRRVRERLGR